MSESDDVIVDAVDVQQLLLRASKANRVKHIFVRFDSAGEGQEFMKRLSKMITWGEKVQANKKFEIAVGISFRGLEALNVPGGYLHIFRHLAPAFAEGAGARAAEHLGDVGASAARYWDSKFTLDSVHAIITIHGPKSVDEWKEWENPPLLDRLAKDLKTVSAIGHLDGKHLDPDAPDLESDPWHNMMEESFFETPSKQNDASCEESPPSIVWVHFGYRDGLTSNRIRTKESQDRARNRHEPGELLLGEPRNAGDNPWSLIDRTDRVRRFFKHGSFGVLRDIEQDERGFRAQVRAWVSVLNLNPEWGESSTLTSFVRAKLCGRWPNGQVVKPDDSPAKQSERKIEGNKFNFGNDKTEYRDNTGDNDNPEDDTLGRGCPFSSHIRRVNPRDKDGVQARQRPLFRRGVPYGPWYREGEGVGVQRGLLGLFFCSDLQDQFEHLLGEWGDRKPLGIEGDRNQKDPLIGAHTHPKSTFAVARLVADKPAGDKAYRSTELTGFKPFVRTRGTAYCFYPSSAALEELGTAAWVNEEDEQWLAR